MIWAVAIIALALPVVTDAATVEPYTPGASPCAGVCSQSWAEAAFDAPGGDPIPITIPAGTYIVHMSEGRAGKPHALLNFGRALASDEPGIGYPIGDGLWMVRLDICLNWAVVRMPATMTPAPTTYTAGPAARPAAYAGRPLGRWHPAPLITTRSRRCERHADAPETPGTPAPVPLPASLPLLALALGALLSFRRIAT